MILVFILFILEGMLCSIIGINQMSSDSLTTISLALMCVNSIALFIHISNRYTEYDRSVLYALFGSLVLKVVLLLWDYYATGIFVLPNSHSDSESFHMGAVLFAHNSTSRVENYSYVVGFIYRYFGVQRITAQFFNIMLSFVGISIFERTMTVLEIDAEAKSRALVLAGLMPNYAIMSAILIRECLISMIVSLSMYLFAKWWKGGNILNFILAELVSMGACYYHAGAVAVTIGIAISLIISRNGEDGERRLSLSFTSLVMAAVFFIGFMYMFDALSDTLLRRFHGLGMDVIDNYIAGHNIYEAEASTTSTYTASITNRTGLAGLIINSPIRIIYFLWVPMPWSIRGLSDIIAFLGSSLFYGGIVFIVAYRLLRGEVLPKNRTLMLTVLLIALSGALVFAWGVDSAGSALRHREKFFFVYLLLYAINTNDKTQDQDILSVSEDIVDTTANIRGYIRSR